MEEVPKLTKNAKSIPGLTEQEKQVLSMIDGMTSISEIARITGFGLSSVKKIIEKLAGSGAVGRQNSNSAQHVPQDQSMRELVLSYENADPFTMLGVPEDADLGRIKDAYFEKTKMFHPDSPYARSVSPEDRRLLTDLYKKIQQAYETLKASAPPGAGRTDAQPTNPGMPMVGKGIASKPAGAVPRQPAMTGPPAAKGRIDDGIIQNVKKAETYYKMGEAALFKSDYSGAFLNFKLASSYNPYKKEYVSKMNDAEEHMKRDRYEDLLKKADISIEINKPDDALGFLRAARELGDDPKFVAYKIALVMYDFNHSLKEAAKYCQEAIVRDPKNPDYHLLLARIYKKAGLLKSSMVEYEQLMLLGVKTDDIRAEVRLVKGMVK